MGRRWITPIRLCKDRRRGSSMRTASVTARIIAEPHGLEVVTTPLLRERDWGGFTGRFIPDLKNEVWPDDIETLENLLSRAGEFIAYVKKTFPGKKVLAQYIMANL